MTTATVFNIQRFSLHDGPGIRTTVFLKGCPLRCLWCHNPESMDTRPEPMIAAGRCIGCELCAPVCAHNLTGRVALDSADNRPTQVCERCGQCAEACPSGARQMAGQVTGAAELLARLRRDAVYHEESGGGVTFSGGEPLSAGNAPLVLECLASLRKAGIDTAVDTCGHVNPDTLQRAAALTNLFLFDLKIMDPERHLAATGRGNRLVHENLQVLLGEARPVWVRVPLIPGWTDDRENLKAMAEFLVTAAGSAGPPPVYLLPWHEIARDKYQRLGLADRLVEARRLTPEQTSACAGYLEERGLTVHIGG
jgi:pyruvate formate lyase activating enzyme